jgi:hypothetical protein
MRASDEILLQKVRVVALLVVGRLDYQKMEQIVEIQGYPKDARFSKLSLIKFPCDLK